MPLNHALVAEVIEPKSFLKGRSLCSYRFVQICLRNPMFALRMVPRAWNIPVLSVPRLTTTMGGGRAVTDRVQCITEMRESFRKIPVCPEANQAA
jgi:hypothetical protein